MISKCYFILYAVLELLVYTGSAQSWTQEATFQGGGRQYSAYFSVGNKGYVGFGNNTEVNDLWEYDPIGNSWTQKASIPEAGGRAEMVSFSIADSGYVGLGLDDVTGESNEFWQFCPASNTWKQVAQFPGPWTRGAIAFSIGTKAYVGSGTVDTGLYEYDALANSWTQKSNIPTAAGHYWGVGFSIGAKGYIGTGLIGSTAQNDFWEYDPTSDSWTRKSNVGGGVRVNAVGFSNGVNGFVGLGEDNISIFYHDFWMYEPGSDSWIQETNYPGAGGVGGIGFVIGCNIYSGLGFNSSGVDQQDFWALPVCNSLPLQATVTQTKDTCYNANNGSASANPTGGRLPYSYLWQPGGQTTISITGLIAGNYALIVTDSVKSTDTVTFTITQPAPLSIVISGDTSICRGTSATLTTTGGQIYSWSPSSGLNSTTGNTVIASPDSTITYTVIVSLAGCMGLDSVTVNVLPKFLPVIKATEDTICAGAYTQLFLTGDSRNVFWQSANDGVSFITIPGEDSSDYTFQLSQTTYFRVIQTGEVCFDTSSSFKLIVNALPIPVVITNDSLICSGSSIQVCTLNAFESYRWNTGDSTFCTEATKAGGYWVTVSDANGCSAVSNHQEVSVYPVSSIGITLQGDTMSSYSSPFYQWYLNDSLIQGANSSVYVARKSGYYELQIVDSNGCKELSNSTYVTVMGIDELPDNGQWKVYPNPFNNLFFIKYTNTDFDIQSIELYDALGLKLNYKCNDNLLTNPVVVQTAELPEGAYWLKIKALEKDYFQLIIKL